MALEGLDKSQSWLSDIKVDLIHEFGNLSPGDFSACETCRSGPRTESRRRPGRSGRWPPKVPENPVLSQNPVTTRRNDGFQRGT